MEGGMVWEKCLEELQRQLSAQQFYTWIRPLQADENRVRLRLFAPNRFVLERVNDRFIQQIQDIVGSLKQGDEPPQVTLEIGRREEVQVADDEPTSSDGPKNAKTVKPKKRPDNTQGANLGNLNEDYTFTNFVEGKSNQLARAASMQVAENPGKAYNPLFVYGGVGLGKTHLMHAVGHSIIRRNPAARISYLHSERFVGDMVKALQHNSINEFKKFYRTLDVL